MVRLFFDRVRDNVSRCFLSVFEKEKEAHLSHRSCWGRASERNPEFFVGTYESITGKASIKATWVGKKPSHRPGKIGWEATPIDDWPTDHDRQGALSEKGNRSRCVMPHLGFKSESSLSKFFR